MKILRNIKMACAALALSVAVAGVAHAAEDAPIIAIVDIQKVESQSKASDKVKEQIKAKRDAFQSEITKKEDGLRELDKKIGEQRSILSPEAFEAKRKEFKEKLLETQRDVQVKRSKLDKAFSKAMGQIQENLVVVVQEIAKEKGFKVALAKAQVVYSDNALDITDEVIKRLNKRLPSVKVDM